MPTLALLTSPDLPDLARGERLVIPELKKLGIDAQPVAWDGDDWKQCDALVVRTIWDYFVRYDEFRKFLDEVAATNIPIFNPLEVLRWNSDKLYLRELEELGVRTPEQIFLRDAAELDLQKFLAENFNGELVVKPTVSAAARATFRVTHANAAEAQTYFQNDDYGMLIVQEFLPEIVNDGEYSIIFFGGECSHTIRKLAAPGDFRVQEKHGGTVEPVTLAENHIEQARAILKSHPLLEHLLYARVDCVLRDDKLILCELEILEPELFLNWSPTAPAAFARAIRDMLALT